MFKSITFFDEPYRENLKPLSFTKPISEFRIGILKIREKWERIFECKSTWITAEYLQSKFPNQPSTDTLFIYGGTLPTTELKNQMLQLEPGDSIWCDDELVVFRGGTKDFKPANVLTNSAAKRLLLDGEPQLIKRTHHLLIHNSQQIKADYELLDCNRGNVCVDKSIVVIGDLFDANGNQQLYIEESAQASHITINLKNGPVYIGRDAEVMEGSMLRGPIAICNNATVNMGARIYSGTTIGPWCKVGGEINNVIFTAYSNKGHEGFLGDSVIGEWCNIGADSNNSNLKNDYSEVKLWNYAIERFEKTGRQFCGLIMGDHSKCGINTMFNTGTVVGVAANIALSGFPRNFVPSFTLTTSKGIEKTSLTHFYNVAERVLARRGLVLNDADKTIFDAIFKETIHFRSRF